MIKTGEFLKKISFIIAIFVGLAFQGCTNPNPGLTFMSKSNIEQTGGSTLEVAQKSGDLDPQTTKSIGRYGNIIQKYAYQYQVDWRLVLAVMKQESSFRPSIVSHRGAYGLMQIMPLTAAEVTQKLGVKNARTPYNNIKTGIFHLKSLYRYFDQARGDERIKLTLAAYNAGLNRIKDAQDVAKFLGEDPNSWNGVKDALPLLSRRFRTLHERVWDDSSPRAGYFRDVRQTSNYVESIMHYYDEYQLALR